MELDDIISMVREACEEDQDPFVSGWITMDHKELERFYALVAAAQKEKDAKIAESWDNGSSSSVARSIARCIRAQGDDA